MADRKTSPFRKAKDSDGDGVSDRREEELGTDPHKKDSDGDGLLDGVEVTTGTDPTDWDSDGDGLSDFAEGKLHLDPNDRDSDGDGWQDGYEVGNSTNPLSAHGKDGRAGYTKAQQEALQKKPAYKDDKDRDRIPDRLEGAGDGHMGTNARSGDSDGDGIGDGIEAMRGTDPTRGDSDNDGRSDLKEVELGKPATEGGADRAPIDWRKHGDPFGPVSDAGHPTADDGRVAAFVFDDGAPATGDGDAFAADIGGLLDPAEGPTAGVDEDAVVAAVDEARLSAVTDEEAPAADADPIDELIARLEAEQEDAVDPLVEVPDEPLVAVADVEPSYLEQELEPIEAGADLGFDDTAPA